MPLNYIHLGSSVGIHDIAPLKGMPLTSICMAGCKDVHDLTPLDGMRLIEIYLPPEVNKGMSVLRQMKGLRKICYGYAEVDDFWTKYENGEFKQLKE